MAVFLGAFIGYQIDLHLKTAPLAMSIGVIVGAMAGLWNAVKIALKEK